MMKVCKKSITSGLKGAWATLPSMRPPLSPVMLLKLRSSSHNTLHAVPLTPKMVRAPLKKVVRFQLLNVAVCPELCGYPNPP